MEVLLGHAFTIDVPSSPPHSPPEYGGDPPMIDEAGERDASTSFSGDGSGFRVGGQPGFFFGDSSESSSSIGTPDDSDDMNDDDVSSRKEEEEEEAESTLKGFVSLDSLEDSLPIKRGLSSNFSGKSKSFTDLSQVSSVKDLQKQENPLNKRRRVQIASKWSRRSSFYAYSNPKSMPLLPLNEDSEPEEEEKEEEKDGEVSPSSPASSSILAEEKKPRHEVNRVPLSYAVHMRHRLGSFKSRSLSLADLQEHDEEEKDDDDDDDDD